jgi:DNA-binding MarR family transcriptional regulator
MNPFNHLRVLRAFTQDHADLLGAQEDRNLIGEIGLHQAKGEPLTLKQLFLLDIGSISTVQRRLRRLKALGLVRHKPSAADRRAVELSLSPKAMRVLARYSDLMSAQQDPGAARDDPEPRHVCGLCDSDAGRLGLLAGFFAQGLKRGDRCVLVAPSDLQGAILDALPDRRRAAERLIVSPGHDSGVAQLEYYGRQAREARQAGQALSIAGDASWAISRSFTVDELFDYEKRLDAMARKNSLRVLCVYDTRRFSGGDLLHAMKCHRDNLRHPVLLG